MASPALKEIDKLAYEANFIASLPADPSEVNVSRPVFGACYSRVQPTPVADPQILALVPEVADLLGLSHNQTPELAAVLAGNRLASGMVPYAACYGGHQFGQWADQLGDGRAITLGEVRNAQGEVYEMQLKGAGPTPYSRRADGRAVLRSSLRELVCSEAMFHLGVPTTRALSLVSTGDAIERDLLYDGNRAFEPGAIVCRVAPSFLRFGNYELPAVRQDLDTLRALLNYTLNKHYPQFVAGDELDLPGFLHEVGQRTAILMVHWTRVGFVHGVMNTDNMSILGLTIDYGPYGWVEPFGPGWTPNITDASGRRYRFGNQPQVALWNLLQLARSLATLVDDVAPLEQALQEYKVTLETQHRQMMLSKLGLSVQHIKEEQDDQLIAALLAALALVETDMTLFYRSLAHMPVGEETTADARFSPIKDAYYALNDITASQRQAIDDWLQSYAARVREEGISDADRAVRMNAVNPLYVPRNYLVQEVIEKTAPGNTDALAQLLEVLRRPYTQQPGREAYARKRPEWARNRPGCSMLSCSS